MASASTSSGFLKSVDTSTATLPCCSAWTASSCSSQQQSVSCLYWTTHAHHELHTRWIRTEQQCFAKYGRQRSVWIKDLKSSPTGFRTCASCPFRETQTLRLSLDDIPGLSALNAVTGRMLAMVWHSTRAQLWWSRGPRQSPWGARGARWAFAAYLRYILGIGLLAPWGLSGPAGHGGGGVGGWNYSRDVLLLQGLQ